MDLGLSSLGDEQLVDLLNEAVMELLSRDACVQQVAQSGLLDLKKKQEAFIRLLQEEVGQAELHYIEALRQDVRAEIARAVQSGELNLGTFIGSAREAKIVVEVTREQIAAIKADLQRAPEQASFSVRYDGRKRELTCSYHSAGQNWDAKRNLTADPGIREKIRTAVLGAFGIPAS